MTRLQPALDESVPFDGVPSSPLSTHVVLAVYDGASAPWWVVRGTAQLRSILRMIRQRLNIILGTLEPQIVRSCRRVWEQLNSHTSWTRAPRASFVNHGHVHWSSLMPRTHDPPGTRAGCLVDSMMSEDNFTRHGLTNEDASFFLRQRESFINQLGGLHPGKLDVRHPPRSGHARPRYGSDVAQAGRARAQ